ncbi:MAG: septum formation initiator family protein [Clostridiales bacterium]|nr:septum formation initiator family protein [Clostridiales bacterium]
MRAVRKKKKSILLRIALLVLFLYVVITLVQLQVQIHNNQQELLSIQQAVHAQRLENDELQQLIDSGDSDATIERIAREKFGYVRPEERVYIASAGD